MKPIGKAAAVGWVDSEGSSAAFVFDGKFSAMRNAAGVWVSPAPSVNEGNLLEDRYKRVEGDAAAALLKAAQIASRARFNNAA